MYDSMRVASLCTIGFLILLNVLLVEPLEATSHVSVTGFPGCHFRELSPLSIYESSVPLTYVLPHNLFELPQKFSLPAPTCPFSDRHLQQLATVSADLDRSLADLLSSSTRVVAKSTSRKKTRRTRAITTIGDFLSWCCACATESELHVMTENEEVVNKHINAVQEVLKGDHMDLVRSVDEMKSFSTNVSQFMDNVRTALWDLQHHLTDQVPSEAIYSAGMLNTIKLQTQLYYSQFINNNDDSQLACRSNLLPRSVVPEAVLRKDLHQLAANLSQDGYEVALSLQDLSPFYSLPVTSCKFSPKKLVVTIKVPIRMRGDKWSLYEYIPSPLAWRNYTCTMSEDADLLIAVSKRGTRTISGYQRTFCDPTRTGLCLLPRQLKGASITSQCAAGLLGGASVDRLRTICPFFCRPSRGEVLLTQVSDSLFVLTHPSPNLVLTCPNSTTSFPARIPGAIEVSIPCDCSLAEGGSIMVLPRFPCVLGSHTPPSFVHILPSSWTFLSNVSIHPVRTFERPVFYNLSHVFNDRWSMDSTSFFIQNHIPASLFDEVQLPNSWHDVLQAASLQYIIVFLWLGFLTLLVFYCTFKLYVMSLVVR